MNWDPVFTEGRDFKAMNLLLLNSILKQSGKTSGSALDLGCGTGDLAIKLAQRHFQVTALDVSKVALKKAAEKAAQANVQIEFHTSDLDKPWPKLDRHFDLITCKLVLAFIKDKDAILSEVANTLKPDGVFILITPILHDNYSYNSRLDAISIQSNQLNELIARHFNYSVVIHEEYFEELGHEQYILISQPKNSPEAV